MDALIGRAQKDHGPTPSRVASVWSDTQTGLRQRPRMRPLLGREGRAGHSGLGRESGPELETFPISVAPPAVWVALLRRLGVPSIWKAHPEIRLAVERLYAKVTERAMALAYGGKGMAQ